MHEMLARHSPGGSDAPLTTPPVEKSLITWQTRMLPFMQGTVVALMVFFFVASCVQLFYLQERIVRAPRVGLSELMPEVATTIELGPRERLELAQLRAMIGLEFNTIERRHHEASVLLMSGVWIRYLGFVTGMIMTLIGAAFILGRLQEQFSELRASAGGAEGMLRSSSPGLVLVVLGTALMMATIVIRHELAVHDAPVYTREWRTAPTMRPEALPPRLDPDRPTDK